MSTIISKRFNLLLMFLILFVSVTANLGGGSFAPSVYAVTATPEHVADKIVTHGYSLIDAYIKELAELTCAFPNGQFEFTLNDGVVIGISPACLDNKIWRQIFFSKPNGQTEFTFLDGPISGQPGTPNQEVIAGAKNTLANFLIESNMIVKKIFKDDVKLNLRSLNDLQVFTDLMFDSIKLSNPPFIEKPATETISEGTLIEITPAEDKDPIKIGEVSSSLFQVATNVYFKNEKKEVKIKVDKNKKESLIEIDGKTISTQKDIKIKNSKLNIETSAGPKEIKVLPDETHSKAQGITNVEKVKLTEESQKPIYSIKGTKQAKLLFLLPVILRLEVKVNAESGEILSVKKPWWSFLAG